MTAYSYKQEYEKPKPDEELKKPFVSIDEYLEREYYADTRSEYINGEIFAMAGTTPTHARVLRNISNELYNHWKDSKCEAFTSDLRVFTPVCNAYFYPDVVTVCEELQLNNDNPQALLNPNIIIEVLSDSTESRDRGHKFQCYRSIRSLQEILFVSQQEPLIEHYVRQTEDLWLMQTIRGLAAELKFESSPCTLRLADIYSRIEFERE